MNRLGRLLELLPIPYATCFDEMPAKNKLIINNEMEALALGREQGRSQDLASAESKKDSLVIDLKEIKDDIRVNDDWFRDAKVGLISVTPAQLKDHIRKAGALKSRKDEIELNLLPGALAAIEKIKTSSTLDEEKEWDDRCRDLESLLRPAHEEREAERRERERQVRERERHEREQEEFESRALKLLEDEANRAAEEERDRLIKQERAAEIRSIADERGIQDLVHFTPMKNLSSILKDGLLSLSGLSERTYVQTDDKRFEDAPDRISTSIMFPNYSMFFQKRKTISQEESGGWAVIVIKKSVLWELDCKFIPTNASSGSIYVHSPRYFLAEAFKRLFDLPEKRFSIPDSNTTDPQAEVMVKDHIPLQYIKEIAVCSNDVKVDICDVTDIPISVKPELFKPRNDHRHWSCQSAANNLHPNQIGG